MKVSRRSTVVVPAALLLALVLLAGGGARVAKAGSDYGEKPDCADANLLCTEVADTQGVFPYYVGHDEPSLLFYSKKPGSGNSMRYQLTLPKDPPPTPVAGRSYNLMLHPAFWFGMAMCDTQSYPEQVSTCKPDSDSNITSSLAAHPGTAFMELQFYSPGYVKQFTGFSCDAVNWCAALTIDSLAEDPVNGTFLNSTCQSEILGGVEYVNFAYLTRNGVPQGPPDPLHFQFEASGDPGPNVLYMHPGDHITVTLSDTAHGLQTVLQDNDTGQSGSMTASAANGFGQIQYAPTGASCNAIPYDFHPMYSTSSPQTRVPWAAHSYNIAFSDEIGHFDFCTHLNAPKGSCNGLEGMPGDQEKADADDNYCFPGSASLLIAVQACLDTNAPGFDGMSYQAAWPDGNTALHPTPIQFTSPLTGPTFSFQYDSAAFEADLPRIEAADFGGSCNRSTGAGCTLPPPTDDGAPVTFYPFYSDTGSSGCTWIFGNDVPGLTANDFGGVRQYGTLYPQTYLAFGGHGATLTRFNDYQNALGGNPCPA